MTEFVLVADKGETEDEDYANHDKRCFYVDFIMLILLCMLLGYLCFLFLL